MRNRDGFLAKAAYACGDIYGGGSFLIVGLLFLAYLTQVEGLSGTWAGVILFVGKAWDAVTDPMMGALSDRTRSKYGRRRRYFLLGALPVFVSWVALWYSFGIQSEAGKIVYYLFSFMLFSTVFTLVMVPYNAILADMTDDYNRRGAFTGVRLSFSAGAAIVCGTVPGMITGALADPKAGYLLMAAVFGAVFGVAWLAVFWGTWERTDVSRDSAFTFREWFSVFENKSFRQYAMVFVFSQMAIDITMALAVFYLGVTMGKDYLYTPVMAAILVVQLVFMMLFSALAQKKGKKVPGLVSAVVWAAASVLIFLFTRHTPDMLIVAVCALIGVGAAGCNLVSWSILPDISDVDEFMTGKRREGLYSGVSTFLRKLSGGIAVGLVGLLLDIFRYSEQAVALGQVETLTVVGVKVMFCALPALLLAAMLIALRGYRLGKREFAVLQRVLQSRREGRRAALTGEEKAVLEQITGKLIEEESNIESMRRF